MSSYTNLSFAARQLWRNPGFTTTVIVTLALSIGANTAIFSLVSALMLKSLPYSHPERMGTIYTRVKGPTTSGDERDNLDGEQWEMLRDNVPALVSAVSATTSGVNLKAGPHVQYVRNGRISAHYFDVLSLQPIVGRNFSELEDRPGGPKSVILSYGVWQDSFDTNPNVLGQGILLKGEPYTVIGVLPRDATTPLSADVYTMLQPSRHGEGGGSNFECITRLKDGATWQEADAEINRAWSNRADRYRRDGNQGVDITYYSVPLQKGETDPLRPQVLALMLAAGLILLIACANLAGLTLIRMMRRTAEVATRLALGASFWQIQKQFWVESLLLALIGGAVGVGAGFVALRGLLAMPEHFLPVGGVAIDGKVMAFTLAVSLLTSILFGMLPTLTARKVELRSSIGDRTVARSGSAGLRQLLSAGQVALTVVLLSGAGLLIRSLLHLETLPPGFNPSGVTVAKASLDDARYHDPAAFIRLLDESTAAMSQIPGTENAAVGLSLPYERALNDGVTLSDGKEAGRQDGTDVVYVTSEYFRTLQMPIVAGRAFTPADTASTQRVAMVNRAFARRFYGGSNPVGRYVNKDTVIVGEVGDVSVSSGLYNDAPLMSEQTMYIPATQVDSQFLSLVHVWFQPDWIVRTRGPVAGLEAQMQHALLTADPSLPVSGFYQMNDLMARTLATQRIEATLLSIMAAMALLLSAVGIFALVANMVAQRTREIGIRMALGSTLGKTMAHVCRSGIVPSLLGIILGLILSAITLRAMKSVLYGVGTYDPITLGTVTVTLLLVTTLAATLPTLRIMRIDPARTLREE